MNFAVPIVIRSALAEPAKNNKKNRYIFIGRDESKEKLYEKSSHDFSRKTDMANSYKMAMQLAPIKI